MASTTKPPPEAAGAGEEAGGGRCRGGAGEAAAVGTLPLAPAQGQGGLRRRTGGSCR